MRKEDFKDYHNSSKMLQFAKVPYTKVFQLRFSKKDLHFVRYKLSHSDQDFQKVSIRKRQRSSRSMLALQAMENTPEASPTILVSRKQKENKQLSQAKVEDIRSMLYLMPIVDQQYYHSIGIS